MKSLIITALLFTGCAQRTPAQQDELGGAVLRTFVLPPYMYGQSAIQRWDVGRYKPADSSLPQTYYECLNATAGQGREPFDTCMAAKGYTR